MSANDIVLHYFDIKGLAEGIRLLFEEAGIEYKEERFTRADWYGSIKEKYQQSGISPYGQVPIVSYNGQHMPQSEAIIRYFANKNGLYGKNDEEQYKCDMIAAGTMDWRRSYVQLVYSDEFDKNLDLYVSQALAQWISNFEKLLSSVDNGENYFCGRELLFCDLLVFDLLELNLRLAAKCLDNAPKLAAFHKRVAARPRIAAYLASDRVPTKINNSGRG
jgi:glutathione S-transferase